MLIKLTDAEARAFAELRALATPKAKQVEMPSPDDDAAWEELEREAQRLLGDPDSERTTERWFAAPRRYDHAGKLEAAQGTFRATMQGLAADMRAGKLGVDDWAYKSQLAIQSHVVAGYILGTAEGKGITPAKVRLTTAQRQEVSKLVIEQFKYFAGFKAAVEGKLAEGQTLTSAVDARARMYGGAMRGTAAQARVSEEPWRLLRWERHAQDSCPTCLAMGDKVKTAMDWLRGGILPGQNTACLTSCQCRLVPAKAPSN